MSSLNFLSADPSQSLTAAGKDSQGAVDRVCTPPPPTDTTSMSTAKMTLPSHTKPSGHRQSSPVNKSNGAEESQNVQPLKSSHINRVHIEFKGLFSRIGTRKQSLSNSTAPEYAYQQRKEIPGLVEFYGYCERLLSEIVGDPVVIEELGEETVQDWQRRMRTKGQELGQCNHCLGKPVPDSDLPSAIRKWN
jgi:hypothetical protein